MLGIGNASGRISDFELIQERVMQWNFENLKDKQHTFDVIDFPVQNDDGDTKATRWLESTEEDQPRKKVELNWMKTLRNVTSVGVDASIIRIESELVYLMFSRCGYVCDSQKLEPSKRLDGGAIVARDLFEYLFDRDLVPSISGRRFFPIKGETTDLGHLVRLIDTQLESITVQYLIQNYGAELDLIYVDGDWLASRKRGFERIGDIDIDLKALAKQIVDEGINYWHLVKNPTAKTFVRTHDLYKQFRSDAAYFGHCLPEGYRTRAYYEKDRAISKDLHRIQIYLKSPNYPMMRLETLSALWDSWTPQERTKNLRIALAQILKNSWQLPLVIQLTHDYVHVREAERIGWMIGLKTLFEKQGVRFKLKLRALGEVLNYERKAREAKRMGD